jgi:hypothetical protein
MPLFGFQALPNEHQASFTTVEFFQLLACAGYKLSVPCMILRRGNDYGNMFSMETNQEIASGIQKHKSAM